jgi:outer membrane protein assembly factor BamD (BamD/ComL family)
MRYWCAFGILIAACTGAFAQAYDNRMDPAATGSRAVDKPAVTIKRGTSWRVKPQRETAAGQLSYAESLRQENRLRAAYRAYNALVHAWPDTAQAVTAQVACAEVLEARGNYPKAFNEYQYLIDRYVGQFDYRRTLEKQFAIANHLMTARRGKVLFLPGFEAPERALPLFETILQNAPSWDKAPLCQYNIGLIHERNEDWEEAVAAFELLQTRYESSAWTEPAAFREAYALYRMTLDRPNDENVCHAARGALVRFIRAYPNSTNTPIARDHLKALNTHYARIVYDRAAYYDRIARRPASALIAYEDFVKRFPTSELAPTAQARIATLRKEAPPHDTP